jgi:hypothetical protein
MRLATIFRFFGDFHMSSRTFIQVRAWFESRPYPVSHFAMVQKTAEKQSETFRLEIPTTEF